MRTLLFILFLLPAGWITAGESPDWSAKDLVKTKMCAVCHCRETLGNQQAIWAKGPHANAFATLGTEKAKAIAARKGIADPQKSGDCLKCHSTAYAFGTTLATKVVKPESGVTCQTCHGPGKRYFSKHAKNSQQAIEKYGLLKSGQALCTRCHNAESPTHDGKPFDFAAAWERIKHSRK